MDPLRIESYLRSTCSVLDFDIGEVWCATKLPNQSPSLKFIQLYTSPTYEDFHSLLVQPDIAADPARRSDEEKHRFSPIICRGVCDGGQIVWANTRVSEGLNGRTDLPLNTAVGVPICSIGHDLYILVLFAVGIINMTPHAVEYLTTISRAVTQDSTGFLSAANSSRVQVCPAKTEDFIGLWDINELIDKYSNEVEFHLLPIGKLQRFFDCNEILLFCDLFMDFKLSRDGRFTVKQLESLRETYRQTRERSESLSSEESHSWDIDGNAEAKEGNGNSGENVKDEGSKVPTTSNDIGIRRRERGNSDVIGGLFVVDGELVDQRSGNGTSSVVDTSSKPIPIAPPNPLGTEGVSIKSIVPLPIVAADDEEDLVGPGVYCIDLNSIVCEVEPGVEDGDEISPGLKKSNSSSSIVKLCTENDINKSILHIYAHMTYKLSQCRFHEFMIAIMGMTVFEAAELWMVSEKTSELFLVAAVYRSPSMQQWISLSETLRLKIGTEGPGKIVETGRPLWDADYAKLNSPEISEANRLDPRLQAARDYNVNTAFGVPLPGLRGICGAVMFYSSKLNFTAEPLIIQLVEKAINLMATSSLDATSWTRLEHKVVDAIHRESSHQQLPMIRWIQDQDEAAAQREMLLQQQQQQLKQQTAGSSSSSSSSAALISSIPNSSSAPSVQTQPCQQPTQSYATSTTSTSSSTIPAASVGVTPTPSSVPGFPHGLPASLPAQLPAQLPHQLPPNLPPNLPPQLPPQLPPNLPANLPAQLPGTIPGSSQQVPSQPSTSVNAQQSPQLPPGLSVHNPYQPHPHTYYHPTSGNYIHSVTGQPVPYSNIFPRNAGPYGYPHITHPSHVPPPHPHHPYAPYPPHYPPHGYHPGMPPPMQYPPHAPYYQQQAYGYPYGYPPQPYGPPDMMNPHGYPGMPAIPPAAGVGAATPNVASSALQSVQDLQSAMMRYTGSTMQSLNDIAASSEENPVKATQMIINQRLSNFDQRLEYLRSLVNGNSTTGNQSAGNDASSGNAQGVSSSSATNNQAEALAAANPSATASNGNQSTSTGSTTDFSHLVSGENKNGNGVRPPTSTGNAHHMPVDPSVLTAINPYLHHRSMSRGNSANQLHGMQGSNPGSSNDLAGKLASSSGGGLTKQSGNSKNLAGMLSKGGNSNSTASSGANGGGKAGFTFADGVNVTEAMGEEWNDPVVNAAYTLANFGKVSVQWANFLEGSNNETNYQVKLDSSKVVDLVTDGKPSRLTGNKRGIDAATGLHKCKVDECNNLVENNLVQYCSTHRGTRRCQHEGCTKCAQGATKFCIAHGGGRRCTFPGCFKGARDKFFCAAHGGGKRCTFEGCNKSAVGGSTLCTAHGGGKRCQFEGCNKSSQSSTNFCVRHGGGRSCAFSGCTKVARGRTDYCAAHGGGVRCRVQQCNKLAVGPQQLCRTHQGISKEDEARLPPISSNYNQDDNDDDLSNDGSYGELPLEDETNQNGKGTGSASKRPKS